MPSEKRFPKNRQKGFSLLEMLVVMAVISVVIAIAVPNFNKADVHFQRQNIARQMKIYFERARFDSVKRDAETFDEMAKVIVNNSTSFSTVLDVNNNGTLEANELRLTTISASSGIKIVGNNLVFPITVTFDQRGQAKAINGSGASVTPTFIVCEPNCTYSTADQANSNTLSVSPTGTVALVEAGQVFFDRTVPNVSSVGSGTNINPMAQVNE